MFVGGKEERNETERTNRERSRRFNSRNCTLNLRYTLNRVTLKDRGNDLGSRVGSAQQLPEDRFFGASFAVCVRAREIYSRIKITFGKFLSADAPVEIVI